MKSRSLLVGLLVLSGAASSAFADGQVKLTTRGAGTYGSSGSGGAFDAQRIGSGFIGVTGGTGHAGSTSKFLTFCLEQGETFAPGTPYNARISEQAIAGGGGASGGGDRISSETAALYATFRRGGNIAGWSVLAITGPSAWSGTLTGALQTAIWHLEGEIGAPGALTDAGKMVTWAKDAVLAGGLVYLPEFDKNSMDASGDMGLIGNVRVLNITDTSGDRKQDQLTMIPLPSGAALAGVGLLAIPATRRRAVSA